MKSLVSTARAIAWALAGCVAPGAQPADRDHDSKRAAAPEQPGATVRGLYDELERHEPSRWLIADGYTNGPVFHCGWRRENALFEDGKLKLKLDDAGCPAACSGKPYAAAEYQSTVKYGYGRYEARMKPAKGSGTMSGSLFTYNAHPQDEIDIEFLGKDTTVLQTNYFANGVGGHATYVPLGFDATKAFHDYAFEWRPDSITWFVDEKPVHREDGSRGPLPKAAGALMLNIWPGHTVDGWLGPLRYEGEPLHAEYEWVKFTPLHELGGEPEAQRSLPKPGAFVPTVSGDALLIDDFETGATAKNGAVWVAEFDRHNLGTRLTPSPFMPSAGGSPDSPGNAGHMSGHLGPSREPWPYAVLSIDIVSPKRPTDLRQFQMLEFWAKGDGRTYRVQLAKEIVSDWGHPEVRFNPKPAWTRHRLPLASFAQPSWAAEVDPAPADVTSLVFGATDGDQDFDLWIDDVRFVK